MKIKKTKASANSWYQYLPILRLEKIAFGTVLQIKNNNFMLYHNFFYDIQIHYQLLCTKLNFTIRDIFSNYFNKFVYVHVYM